MKQKAYIETNDFSTSLENYLSHFDVLDSEFILSEQASNRVTAKAVFAKTCDPMYNAAAMDGIAVFSENTLTASDNAPLELFLDKDFVYVNTGNPIFPPFDSVIMIEDVLVDSPQKVRILSPSHPWQNVRVIGESVVATEMILPSKTLVRPIDIGAVLAGGNDQIEVIKIPKVGIIPTGREMVNSAKELGVGKLRESNSHVFCALSKSYGAEPVRYDIVDDNPQALETILKKAVVENDVIVINAGSSAGTKDFTVDIISKLGKVYTHGLAVKPGKPTILGEIDNKPVIGVPGYPVSAYIIFDRVVQKVIDKVSGRQNTQSATVKAELTKRVTSQLKFSEFVRVALGKVNNKLVATPLDRGAAAVMSMVKADGIMTISRNSEGIEAGATVDVELLKPLSEIEKALVIVGSHDMIIDIIGDSMPLCSAHVGSLSGILTLKKQACNIAPIHLLDEVSGVYNEAYARQYFPNVPMALVKGVGRIQGILTQKGNPKNIASISDIVKNNLSFANRQGGAGTRILFDYLLAKNGFTSNDVKGYEKEFNTHLAVATAVLSKDFDCGLAVMTAANIMDLDFIPVGREDYDFLVYEEFLTDPRFIRFLEILKSDAFKLQLKKLGGYTTEHTGEIKIIK